MLAVLSPAKNLDYTSPWNASFYSEPEFLDDSERLIEQLRRLTAEQIGGLMNLSETLSALNSARFRAWQRPFTPDNARPAILAFNGAVYAALDAGRLSEDDLRFAQSHLRIISGLYGLLKPLDLMQPYRLEMGTQLANERGANLYHFWRETITHRINALLDQQAHPILLNLASAEYFKAVDAGGIRGRIVTPQFKDEKNGRYTVFSFFAKKARGLMASYLIRNRVQSEDELKHFRSGGYCFSDRDSSDSKLVFLRNEAAREAV